MSSCHKNMVGLGWVCIHGVCVHLAVSILSVQSYIVSNDLEHCGFVCSLSLQYPIILLSPNNV